MLMIQECSVSSIIGVADAKANLYICEKDEDAENEKEIFNGYIYQLYDNDKLVRELGRYYIEDMVIDYHGFRIVAVKKWK